MSKLKHTVYYVQASRYENIYIQHNHISIQDCRLNLQFCCMIGTVVVCMAEEICYCSTGLLLDLGWLN